MLILYHKEENNAIGKSARFISRRKPCISSAQRAVYHQFLWNCISSKRSFGYMPAVCGTALALPRSAKQLPHQKKKPSHKDLAGKLGIAARNGVLDMFRRLSMGEKLVRRAGKIPREH